MTTAERHLAVPRSGRQALLRSAGGTVLASLAAAMVAIEHGFVREGVGSAAPVAGAGSIAPPLVFGAARLLLAWLSLVIAWDVAPWHGAPGRWRNRVGMYESCA